MFSVFMFGDAVRLCTDHEPGYGAFAIEELVGRAYVYSPAEDCGSTHHTLLSLRRWIGQEEGMNPAEVAAVHWNLGLGDVARGCGGEPVTPLAVYLDRLEIIHRYLAETFPNARLIFATTTPVIERRQSEPVVWRNDDILLYNRAAVERLVPLGAAIDDLHAVACGMEAERCLNGHDLSWEGAMLLGRAVAACILREVGGC